MKKKVKEALGVLIELGLPRAQQNERSALCLLALCNLKPTANWAAATAACIGITPIMEFAAQHYRDEPYAPNTRETIRRQTMHQFCAAGIALYNPDAPDRPTNSPKAVYQLSSEMLALLQSHGTSDWPKRLLKFQQQSEGLAARYAQARTMALVPLAIAGGQVIQLSPGDHSTLIRQIIEVFAPHYAPGSTLIYVGDTGKKWGYYDESALAALGVVVSSHGKMPDVVIHDTQRNWLLLCEAVTSHGPVDGKRHAELKALFAGSSAGLVYVTALPSRAVMARYLSAIAWETEVWCAESPTHLIHFNGERFLGPYDKG